MNKHMLILPGDGVGEEVVAEVIRLIDWLNSKGKMSLTYEKELVGGCCYDAHGCAILDSTMEKAQQADAVLLGCVGGPKWEGVEYDKRPEAALLRLRKELGLFANLRPALCFKALADSSSLKRNIIEGLDILIVRELTGGVYFGKPRGITDLGNGQRRGINTQIYDTYEIQRIAHQAFTLARKRGGRVCSVEKRNVMESGLLWYEEVIALHQEQYTDVQLSHMLADNCAMQLVRNPKQFDVILTDNLFGDILSDIASMLTGSLGMLPSASLGAEQECGKIPAMYEPVHGSAPDIAGMNIVNPLATILSFTMALRYSFNMIQIADLIENCIAEMLEEGVRTADIANAGEKTVSTKEVGEILIEKLDRIEA